MALLQLADVRVRYGSVEGLHGVNLRVEEGEIVTILGANGAGKSTTLLSISGLVRPFAGEILFEGQNLLRLPSHKVVDLGIAQSPEGRRVFGVMSVLENLRLGAFCVRDKARSEKTLEWIFDLFPRLLERKDQLAGTLSGGEQQMLAIGRALMAQPRLLLLDEPAAGMNPSETAELMHQIRRIRDTFHVAIFLIEHDMNLVMNVCEAIAVVNYGRIIAKGTSEEIQANPAVIEAYLGKEEGKADAEN